MTLANRIAIGPGLRPMSPDAPANAGATAAAAPAQAHLTLGVIGHVDHGKTSLVRAISGMETDRLEEERRRGMSIVLGFAWMAFEEGIVDIIDVPGHEQFIRTMVAGATGIDAVLLVVDAREGIMPQTAEHVAITGLLNVRRGLIAITKSDLVDAEERQLLRDRLRGFLRGSHLQDAPVVFTSTVSGEGVQEIGAGLRSLLKAQMAPAASSTRCYLPVDRVFSLRGSGTIVTGTLRAGRLALGDELELLPSGQRTSVRQLQCHNHSVDVVLAGQRVGVNLRHLDTGDISRGDVLAPVGSLRASCLLDVEITLVPGASGLCDGQTVRLLMGTSDVAASVRILAPDGDGAGQRILAQLRTRRPVVAAIHEPFILRNDSPSATLGGGRVLDPAALWLRRSDRAGLDRLRILAQAGGMDFMIERVKAAEHRGMPLSEFADALAGTGIEAGGVPVIRTLDNKLAVYEPALVAMADRLDAALKDYHAQSPWHAGAPLSWCRASLPADTAPAVFRTVLQDMSGAGRIDLFDGLVRLRGHDPLQALPPADRRLALHIEERLRDGGVAPPDVAAVADGRRPAALLRMLVDQGRCLLLEGEGQLAGLRIAFHRDAVEWALKRLDDAYAPPARFTVSDARVLWNTSRKFAVPLLAHFDKLGYTRRSGDFRKMDAICLSARQSSQTADYEKLT